MSRSEELRAREERARIAEDARFMQDPGRWQHFGVLPVAERVARAPGEPPRVGFMRVWSEVCPVVYLANLYTLAEQKVGALGPDDPLQETRYGYVAYLDFESLAAQWRID